MASQLVEGAMVEWSSYVRGHHVYLELWTPSVGEVLSLKDNNHDNYCVAVMKGYTVVGHVPRPASNVCFHTFWAEMATGGSVKLQEDI